VCALSALAVLVVNAAACSEPSGSSASGNDVVDDTRPQPRPPANPDEGMDASSDAPTYGEGGPEAATLVLNACDTCACSPDQYYCFGGATTRALPLASSEAGASGDGGGAGGACPVVGAGASVPQVGCNALPAGCTDCACILTQLQPKFACYLVCATDKQLLVYCPHP
jgi:hypothetical protein